MPDQQMPNPYAPPKSDATSDDVGVGIAAFPRHSTLWLLAVSVVTLGIYSYYWSYDRSRMLNRLLPQNPVPPLVWQVAIGAQLLNVVSDIPAAVFPSIYWPDELGIAIATLALVANVVWTFAMRNRLNVLVGATRDSEKWFHAVFALLLSSLYLCYKINRNIEFAHARS